MFSKREIRWDIDAQTQNVTGRERVKVISDNFGRVNPLKRAFSVDVLVNRKFVWKRGKLFQVHDI